MLYESKYSDLQVIIRARSLTFHHATGVQTGEIPPLVARFGMHHGEISVENPLTGEVEQRALIQGHFYDTDAAAESLGWTEDEKESVEAALDRLCKQQPFLIAKIEHEAPVFGLAKPWPSYDETHWKTVSVLAKQLGLVDEVLAYERANAKREGVLNALEENVEEVAELEEAGAITL